MQKTSNCPRDDCRTNKEITGCRFSLSVMSDNYINMILGAIQNINTKNIWSHTDALSTTYRGKRIHVVDAVKACFVNINDGKTHITMESTFSKGCPGDTDADVFLAKDDMPLNQKDKKFNMLSKISLYPLGATNYMEHIAYVVELATKKGVYKCSSHYATELEGDVNVIFDYYNEVMDYAEKKLNHYVLQATLSVNSPIKD